MTEIERVRQAIARCETKRAAVSDDASKRYYDLCIIGWRAWLTKLERGDE